MSCGYNSGRAEDKKRSSAGIAARGWPGLCFLDTDHIVFRLKVLTLAWCGSLENDDCEVCFVIRFMNTRNVEPVQIHRRLVEIYGESGFDNSMCEMGGINADDEARSGRSSVDNDSLIDKVNEQLRDSQMVYSKIAL
ncbi:hypothetical protein TNCV_460231 [Trichonephila clavipes]|nr:hypothetical protein TNCV_460231 [Trichonephila clavipes]